MPASAGSSRASRSRHTSALATMLRARPLPEPLPTHAPSNAGLRARAIGGASVGSSRCARMARPPSQARFESPVRCTTRQGPSRRHQVSCLRSCIRSTRSGSRERPRSSVRNSTSRGKGELSKCSPQARHFTAKSSGPRETVSARSNFLHRRPEDAAKSGELRLPRTDGQDMYCLCGSPYRHRRAPRHRRVRVRRRRPPRRPRHLRPT